MSTNGTSRKISKPYKPHQCNGCGRVIPKGWECLRWSVWFEGARDRLFICADCAEVIYGCKIRPPLSYEDNELLVRDMCSCCDDFPTCEKASYLREKPIGSICFSAFGENHAYFQSRSDERDNCQS